MASTLAATLALLLWPIVSLAFFCKKKPFDAAILTILGAQLLLPVGTAIKLPGVPQFDKETIGNLAALGGVLAFSKVKIKFFHTFGVPELLIVSYVVGALITSEANGDYVQLLHGALPPLGHYDGLSAMVAHAIVLIPYFLGRSLCRGETDIRRIFVALVSAGLLYSVPLLFEIRFSPQLHGWVYGYFPGEFYQEIRAGGFRPVVFMGHGLIAAFFVMTTVVAATAAWRAKDQLVQMPSALATGYLTGLLVLCKSFGATLYMLFLTPIVRLASLRFQSRVAIVLALLGLTYPVLRTADLVPTHAMVEAAAIFSAERAASLETRFDQERQLLDRALQKPTFGWGRWGRSRIYNEDLDKDVSITDGRWIITLGQFGLVGFFSEFGFLVLAVLQSRQALRRSVSGRDQIYLAALSLIVAINIIELLPNSALMPWTMFLAGSLLGRSEYSRAKSPTQPVSMNSLDSFAVTQQRHAPPSENPKGLKP